MNVQRRLFRSLPLVVPIVAAAACGEVETTAPGLGPDGPAEKRTPGRYDGATSVELGRLVFFDERLSLRGNQSCATCHAPEFGFAGPIPGVNTRGGVYRGSVASRAGARRPPSTAYATQAPVFGLDPEEGIYVGGNFWDGRATGEVLGNPAADQAQGPFLNPVEQALRDAACVVFRVREGPYAEAYAAVWGDDLSDIDFPDDTEKLCRREGPELDLDLADRALVDIAYDRIALSIADFEASPEVNAFSSKYDAYLAGGAELTAEEQAGLELYQGKALCSQCHPSAGEGALFTDYTFDNIGVPANPLNPAVLDDPGFVDLGLGGRLGDPTLDGSHKVPTLRNIARAPGNAPRSYMHNGVFKSLEQVVHFYNTRDAKRECAPGEVPATPAGLRTMGFEPDCWPAPEVARNVNDEELGDLGLTLSEEAQLVAFLRTLDDGWR